MTLDSFITQCGKSKDTVLGWLNKNYVPGAYPIEGTDEWHIPDNARTPYTKRKPKNGGAKMYKSLANAVAGGYGICHELYNLPQQRFDIYVTQLIEAGIITSYIVEDVIYYEPTLETLKFVKMSDKVALDVIAQLLEAGSKGTSQGVTEGLLSGVGA